MSLENKTVQFSDVQKEVDEVILALKRRHIACRYFEDAEALLEYISKAVKGKVVGVGDSITFEEIELYDLLKVHSGRYLNKYDERLTKIEKRKLYRENFSAEVFFSGINALSMSGKIYNLDGNGSRVAPIIYGPDKVFLICGTNKLCRTDEEAVLRVRQKAAPMDAVRLGKKTPCAITGKCVDCRSKERICNYMTIVEGQFDPDRIEVILLKGSYGY
ncbi:lactate utilization protein [Fusibacter ferrireducens]|uniref:Lactate utilization protein n=1 Tax=Fusibacter ferrireducens TaxID=2785058 RepID=A0ABR9ZU34_9FIRM|nr:lactate utilization protein [Fusibacter ferrireducens]MBF4693982.1 lactate utilization protein [Fusibacter ferrireducens]